MAVDTVVDIAESVLVAAVVAVVANSTVDRTDYRIERHSLPDHYTGDNNKFAASQLPIHPFVSYVRPAKLE